MTMNRAGWARSLDFARSHAKREVSYDFTIAEDIALDRFFSNTDRYIFLVQNLPSNVRASMLAMYSRLKNERGLRGVFVDMLLPHFLATRLDEVERYTSETGKNVAEFLKEKNANSLDRFIAISSNAHALFQEFLEKSADPDYLHDFANSKKTSSFLSTWIDTYGHTSIARMGEVVVCFEEISILAAKAIEHPRPGAGYIELSTRYVDMTKASWYDIAGEIAAIDVVNPTINQNLREFADVYLGQTKLYTDFLRGIYPDVSDGAIFGEVCDVMANALPAAANTSVGCTVSGETIRSLIKCLLLEGLSETTAIAEVLLEELGMSGLGQFVRHIEPSDFERRHTRYMDWKQFVPGSHASLTTWTRAEVENPIIEAYNLLGEDFLEEWRPMDGQVPKALKGRGSHDKLPPPFEDGHVRFSYRTTFRTWREIQRHVMARNERTLLTPYLGFFQHSKPISDDLKRDFDRIALIAANTYNKCSREKGVSAETLQYILPMGFNVGATFGSNVRNMEFFTWQRSGFNVNHEARQVALNFDAEMVSKLPWWDAISRTDRTRTYRFAREKEGVPI